MLVKVSNKEEIKMTPNAQSTKEALKNQSSDLFGLNSSFSELQLCDLGRAEVGTGSKAENAPETLTFSSMSTLCCSGVSKLL